MIRILLTGAAVIVTFPAVAQSGATAVADPAVIAPVQTDTATQATTPAGTASILTAAAATPASSSDIVRIVDSEFPTYDADKSGTLSQTEFAAWLSALKEQEVKATGKAMSPADISAWASGAFATADKDKNAAVTKEEITHYLGG